LLLKEEANIDEKDSNGKTALLHASLYGHETIIQLLIKKGADIKAKCD